MLNKVWGSRRSMLSAQISAGALVSLLAAGPALGQVNEPNETAPVADRSNGAIVPIIVTARRQEEDLRDVPFSVAAVQPETITQQNIIQMEDLTVYVPNFRQANGSIGTFRFIRGAGSGSNLSFEQAVGTFFDDVYAGRSQQARLPFFDVERIEVLRGPQVLLYGNSTTAGAVSVISRRPGDEFSVDFDAGYEFENQELILRGGLTVPIADGVGIRVSGMSQTLDDGWLTSITRGQERNDLRFDNQAARAIILAEPTDNLTIMLKAETGDLWSYGNTLQAITNALNNPAITESEFDRIRIVGQPAPFNIPQDFTHLEPDSFVANVALDLGSATVTSTTAYTRYFFTQSVEGDLSPLSVFNFAQTERYRQFSQELRVNGEIDRLDYVVGAYYQYDKLDAAGFTDTNLAALGVPVPPFARRNELHQRTRNWSVFADLTWNVTPELRFGAGARLTRIRKRADQIYRAADIGFGDFNPFAENLFIPPFNNTLFGFAFGIPHEFQDIRRSESHFMPQFVAQYDITDDIMLFARVARGAKAGGVDWLYAGNSPDEAQFLPEIATSYEAGVRATLLDRTLQLDVTAFRTDFSDLQVSIFNGTTNFVVGNAASSRSQGLELELDWRATPNLRFGASVAYLDSTYRSFPGAGCYFEQRATAPAGVPCVQDLSGSETPYSSKWSGTARAEYRAPIGEYELVARTNANFRSSYNPSLNDDPVVQQDGFVLIDANLSFGPTDGPWTIAVFGKNLTDELYTEQTSDTPIITGSRFATTSRGRQIGLQFGFRY